MEPYRRSNASPSQRRQLQTGSLTRSPAVATCHRQRERLVVALRQAMLSVWSALCCVAAPCRLSPSPPLFLKRAYGPLPLPHCTRAFAQSFPPSSLCPFTCTQCTVRTASTSASSFLVHATSAWFAFGFQRPVVRLAASISIRFFY